MQPIDSTSFKCFDLRNRLIDADFKLIVRRPKCVYEIFWQLRAAQRRNALNLFQVGDWQKSGNDGNVDATGITGIAETEKVIVAVEQLRDHRIGTGVNFSLQVVQVYIHAGRFAVLFWIAGDKDSELIEFGMQEINKLIRVLESAFGLFKRITSFRRVAT